MERPETAPLLPSTGPLEDSPLIGYICPLYTELVAVLATFDQDLDREEIDQDEYYYGRIGNRMVVAAHFLHREMGPQAASRLADNMLKVHPTLKQPRSIRLLVGIAGGIWTEDRDIRLGDAVIATQIWNWRDGKLTEDDLKATGWPQDVSRRLRQRLPSFLYNRDTLGQSVVDRLELMRKRDGTNDLRWRYPGSQHDRLYLQGYAHVPGSSCATHDPSQTTTRIQRGNDLPTVHDGLVASGNVVLKDAKSRGLLHKQGVYAVEMEACGVLMQDFLVVRGISDYADSHKNDVCHAYAAAVAAACFRLLVDHLNANEKQDSSRLHRFISCPSDVPSLSQAQEAFCNSSTSVRTDNELALQPPLRRATRTDPVLPAAHHLSTSASRTRSLPSPVTRQTPLLLPSRLITQSTEKSSSTSDSPDARSTARDITSTSGGSPVNESGPAMVRTSTLDEAATHSAPWRPRKTCYSATWECVTLELRDRTRTPPEVTRERSWRRPTTTVILQNAEDHSAAFAPACFLIFTSDEVDTGTKIGVGYL